MALCSACWGRLFQPRIALPANLLMPGPQVSNASCLIEAAVVHDRGLLICASKPELQQAGQFRLLRFLSLRVGGQDVQGDSEPRPPRCKPLPWVSIVLAVFAHDPELRQTEEFLVSHCRAALATRQLLVVKAHSEYFEASVAKNSSHMAAITYLGVPEELLLLINLDCDNLVSVPFLQSVGSAVTVSRQDPRAFFSWAGQDGGVTGRAGLRASTFLEMGGYDQSFSGSGYQDIDLRERARRRGTWHKMAPPAGGRFPDHSIPNHADVKVAHGRAKTANLPPQHRVLSWGQMNAQNRDRSLRNIAANHLVANTDVPFLGAPLQLGVLQRWELTYQASGMGAAVVTESPVAEASGSRPPRPVVTLTPARPLLASGLTWGQPREGERMVDISHLVRAVPLNVQFVTMGLKVLTEMLHITHLPEGARLNDAVRHGRAVPDVVLQAALHIGGVCGPNARVLGVDCRELYDPGGSSWHSGLAPPPIVLAVTENARFHGWFGRTAGRFFAAYNEAGDRQIPLTVVFYCNKGRHRSVSGCLLLNHVLQSSYPDVAPSHTEHTSRALWAQRGCGNCRTVCVAPSIQCPSVGR